MYTTSITTQPILTNHRPWLKPLLSIQPQHRSNLAMAAPHQFICPSSNWLVVTSRRCSSPSVIVNVSLNGDVFRDAGAAALVLGGGYGLVSVFDYLTERDVITQSLSRKLVHILSGLIFMASWPLFSAATEARYFASLAPLMNCLRLVVHGLSLATNEGLIKALTREGKPEELLRGPLFYVMVLAFCAWAFWRDSPVGVIALAMMCGGDGVADIMGRKFGRAKLPYNQNKSWVGSISMFAIGFMISLGMLYYFSALGYFQVDWPRTTPRIALISFIATMIESLPANQLMDDNISVPVVTIFAAYVCFCL